MLTLSQKPQQFHLRMRFSFAAAGSILSAGMICAPLFMLPYVRSFWSSPMSISLTELRQRLFQLADQVIDTGVPLVIERRGIQLRLVRVERVSGGRLSKLTPQSLVVGDPLDPSESPATWSELPQAMVATSVPAYRAKPPSKRPPSAG